MNAADRTRTAHVSPFLADARITTPLVLLSARAAHAAPTPEPRFVLPAAALTIGRRPAGAGALGPGALLLDDPLASSQHARLYREGEAWWLADAGSKNGTWVDGVRITEPASLSDGARIFVGNHVLVFRLVSAEQVEAIKEEQAAPLGPVATLSPRLASLCSKLRRLARSETEILFVGETGVGKEVYARAVAAHSGRTGRFVALNCAAIPRELVESELFGYRSGAHSTAQTGKPGLIELAEGGTLFLDEIGEMSNEAQSKLLRFLQDRELTPLGATRPRRIDVRVLAATNRELLPGSGRSVRDDLLGRLGAAPMRIPPLRERMEDLGALLAYFLRAAPDTAIELGALRILALGRYPLNVRELEKIVAAAVALAGPSRPIGVGELPETLLHPASAELPAPEPTQSPFAVTPSGRKPPEPAPSQEELHRLLSVHAGNVADVARAVGRQRAAVWRWLKRYGLDPHAYRR